MGAACSRFSGYGHPDGASVKDDERDALLTEALLPLGWNRVQRLAPWRSARLWGQLDPEGGMLNGRRGAFDRHHNLAAAVLNVLEILDELSPKEVESLDLHATDPDERDRGLVPAVSNVHDSLEKLIPGILADGEIHQAELPLGKKNIAAYRIVDALAEIYVIGKGQRPTASRHAINGGPSGVFPRAADKVLRILGHQIADIYPLCKAAKQSMSDDRFEALLRIHRGGEAAALRHRISLFSVN